MPPRSPAQAYVNPAFTNLNHQPSQAPPQVDPNALAQVMSFMSTPAGVQSMAAFANHMTSSGTVVPSYPQTSQQPQSPPAPRYSPPQHAGQKRKLNDRHNNTQSQSPQKAQQQSTKPPRAKAAVPPPVPSFGFSLPTPKIAQASTNSKGNKDQKKRKVNLGLTEHRALPDESTEPEEVEAEEDVDEEAAYATKLKGGGFAFEHEGEQISIRTAAEVAAWIKDRRRQFPTQKRIVEKADEAAAKRASELDFLRKLKGKPPRSQEETNPGPIAIRHDRQKGKPKRVDPKKQADEQRRQEELAALRKRLHESMVKKQAAPTKVDLGLGYASETESDAESSVLSESSVVSSSDESSEEESEAESEKSDEAPVAISSKAAPPEIKVPPPVPVRPKPTTNTRDQVCAEWGARGRCRFSNKCKFSHPKKDIPRMGLYERMIEQELLKADELALDAIKYLGQHGFLN